MLSEFPHSGGVCDRERVRVIVPLSRSLISLLYLSGRMGIDDERRRAAREALDAHEDIAVLTVAVVGKRSVCF